MRGWRRVGGEWRHAPWWKRIVNGLLRAVQPGDRKWVIATRCIPLTDPALPPIVLGYELARVLHLPKGPPMILVIVESPYAGDVERNLRYLRAAMRDCLLRGEAPFASHALYTQPGVLDDEIPAERELGMMAGLWWGGRAAKTVVYTDLGVSPGMRHGIEIAERAGRPVEMRSLPGAW